MDFPSRFSENDDYEPATPRGFSRPDTLQTFDISDSFICKFNVLFYFFLLCNDTYSLCRFGRLFNTEVLCERFYVLLSKLVWDL